jgi:hypothetical protein
MIDSHIHFCDASRWEDFLRYLPALKIEKAGLVSLPDPGAGNFNPELLFAKLLRPADFYLFGELDYSPGAPPFGTQTEALHRAGFDGVKLILGKPAFQRTFRRGLLDPEFGQVFDTAGRLGLPVLAHFADPVYFWPDPAGPETPAADPPGAASRGAAPPAAEGPGTEDTASAGSPAAGETGAGAPAPGTPGPAGGIGGPASDAASAAQTPAWSYGPEDPSFEDCVQAAETLAGRHKDTVFIFPHLLFLAHDLGRLDRLFGSREGLYVDLAPGKYFYADLSDRREEAREFFREWGDRILFGTDGFFFGPSYKVLEYKDLDTNLRGAETLLRFLESDRPFPNPFGPTAERRPEVRGLSLRELPGGTELLAGIYRGNFERIFGPRPRPLEGPEAAAYLEDFLAARRRGESAARAGAGGTAEAAAGDRSAEREAARTQMIAELIMKILI